MNIVSSYLFIIFTQLLDYERVIKSSKKKYFGYEIN